MLGQWYYELFDLQSHCQDFLFPSRASCIWQLQLCRFKPFMMYLQYLYITTFSHQYHFYLLDRKQIQMLLCSDAAQV